MDLSRRAVLLAAASLARGAAAADLPNLVCPLTAAPPVLVPGVSRTLATCLVGGQIYRGLMRWGPDGELEPDLATALTVSADGLTYTAELRSGVTWHDSGAFSSADVAFSVTRFHRALQPALRLGQVTVDTPGPLTVVLTLPAPDPGFLRRLNALSLPIVPQHVHDRAGWALDPWQVSPVGTGPFRWESWLRLVRFEWYAGPKPGVAAVDCPVLPDPSARAALADGGGVVLLVGDAVDRTAVPRLRALPAVSVEAQYPWAARSIVGLRLNTTVHPLDQKDVRLALAHAIDRQAALRGGWSGLGRVATGFLVSGSPGRSETADLPGYDPRAASDRLRASGLRPDDSGIRARLTCLHPPGPAWTGMLGAVRRSLLLVGIDLAAEAVTAGEWQRRVDAGEYEITVFTASQAGDPAADLAAYPATMTSMTPPAANGTIEATQERLLAEMPVLPLVEPAVPVVRPSGLQLPRGALGSFEGAGFG